MVKIRYGTVEIRYDTVKIWYYAVTYGSVGRPTAVTDHRPPKSHILNA